MVAPFLPSFPYYVKCPSCDALFKLSDNVRVGEIHWYRATTAEVPEEWEKAPYVEFLTIDEYRQAIEKGLSNSGPKDGKEWKEDIVSLRLNLWRSFNDSNRDSKSQSKLNEEDKRNYDENCRAILAAMADDIDEEYLLVKAEIHRNLGEFKQCKNLLNRIKEQDGYKPYIVSISKACDAKNTFTVRVVMDDEIRSLRLRLRSRLSFRLFCIP
jgi:hypothetical protein